MVKVDYSKIDPDMRGLCRTINESGLGVTAWSCQGHPWSKLWHGFRDHKPYLVIDATSETAALLHAAICHATSEKRLNFWWDVKGMFLIVEADPTTVNRLGSPSFTPSNVWRLRWSLECSTLSSKRWWLQSKVRGDLAVIGLIVEDLAGNATKYDRDSAIESVYAPTGAVAA